MSASNPTAKITNDIAAFVRAGGHPEVAAEAAGVPRDVFLAWMRRADLPRAGKAVRDLAAAVRTAAAQARLTAETEVRSGKPLDWLKTERSFILIRDPARMIASFARKFDDVAPIIDSYRVCRRIFDYCADTDQPCPVIDAADILADPPRMLAALCAALDISFDERMLSWPAGSRATDGPWAPHWYDAVNASTGFRKAQETPLEPDAALARLAVLAEPDYQFFRRLRIR